MCLQDQRIVARATWQYRTGTNSGASPMPLPDMSKALYVFCRNAGAPTGIFQTGGVPFTFVLPRDTRLSTFGTNDLVYSREQCGSAFLQGLSAEVGTGNTYDLWWLEMDDETYTAIANL